LYNVLNRGSNFGLTFYGQMMKHQ